MSQLLRFALSGGAAAVVYCVVLVQLSAMGLRPWLSGFLGYLLSMPVAFVLHKMFTFRSDVPYKRELPRFIATSLIGIILASATPALLTSTSHVPMPWVALMTSIVTPLITYILMSLWVFRQPR